MNIQILFSPCRVVTIPFSMIHPAICKRVAKQLSYQKYRCLSAAVIVKRLAIRAAIYIKFRPVFGSNLIHLQRFIPNTFQTTLIIRSNTLQNTSDSLFQRELLAMIMLYDLSRIKIHQYQQINSIYEQISYNLSI